MPCPCCGPKPCCCVDGQLSEITPPAECTGSAFSKPAEMRDLSDVTVTVEWCDLTITLTEANGWSDDSGQVALGASFNCFNRPFGNYTLTTKRLEFSATVRNDCNYPTFLLLGKVEFNNASGVASWRLVCAQKNEVCELAPYYCGGEAYWCTDNPCPDLPTITINWAP